MKEAADRVAPQCMHMIMQITPKVVITTPAPAANKNQSGMTSPWMDGAILPASLRNAAGFCQLLPRLGHLHEQGPVGSVLSGLRQRHALVCPALTQLAVRLGDKIARLPLNIPCCRDVGECLCGAQRSILHGCSVIRSALLSYFYRAAKPATEGRNRPVPLMKEAAN